MSKSLTLTRYQAALNLWQQLILQYPKCFYPTGQEKPLKIGIVHDLLAQVSHLKPAPTKQTIKNFMAIYTGTIFYRAAFIKPEAARVDLEGKIGEPISQKERMTAKIQTRKLYWALEEGYETDKAREKAKRNQMATNELDKKKTLLIKNCSPASKTIELDKLIVLPKPDVSKKLASNKKPAEIIIKKKRKIIVSKDD